MLPRCSSSWLQVRAHLPTRGSALQIPASPVKGCTTRNFTGQLSLSRYTCNSHKRPQTLPSLLSSRPSLYPQLSRVMASQQPESQKRGHSGHGHHHHNHDNTYLVSNNKNDAGVRITRIGLFVNLAMAIAKGVGGYVFHSQCRICPSTPYLTNKLTAL